MSVVAPTRLRARFAERLSALYATEVPAYGTLVEVTTEVNQAVLRRSGADAERLGSIARVTAERHGAIRVGSPRELAQVARIFAALGMHPCGFYDLRDAAPAPVPVVSTAFRPLDRDELAINPFRVFTSMLVPEDRRFFDADLQRRLCAFLDARRLFPEEVLELADRAVGQGHLGEADAERFLDLATACFALSRQPVDRAWYSELERVSGVAADIGGVTSTHLNHLTPRVLDIDVLYTAMEQRGIAMIDQIQGPPRWDGPDVLLRQTSFRALAEPRDFREPDGRVLRGELRVRFGEVEARGIALTPAGRERYDRMLSAVDEQMAGRSPQDRPGVAVGVWEQHLPRTERGLCLDGLGFFTYRVDPVGLERAVATSRGPRSGQTVAELVGGHVLVPEPIVYEDFLPRSAAGIFASNLTHGGSIDGDEGGAERTIGHLADIIGAEVRAPEEVYAEEAERSLVEAERAMGALLAGGAGGATRPVSIRR